MTIGGDDAFLQSVGISGIEQSEARRLMRAKHSGRMRLGEILAKHKPEMPFSPMVQSNRPGPYYEGKRIVDLDHDRIPANGDLIIAREVQSCRRRVAHVERITSTGGLHLRSASGTRWRLPHEDLRNGTYVIEGVVSTPDTPDVLAAVLKKGGAE